MTREEHLVDLTEHEAPRVVLGEAHLLQHDALLEVERGRVERRVHADVGEHLDACHGAPGREDGVIVGVVERRSRVDPAADPFHLALDEARRSECGALEEHVLEVVREPELGGRLVSATGADPELDGDDLARLEFLYQDAHAVAEDLEGWRWALG